MKFENRDDTSYQCVWSHQGESSNAFTMMLASPYKHISLQNLHREKGFFPQWSPYE
jgi:hypothetical protein